MLAAAQLHAVLHECDPAEGGDAGCPRPDGNYDAELRRIIAALLSEPPDSHERFAVQLSEALGAT